MILEEIEQIFINLGIGDFKDELPSDFKIYVSVKSLIEYRDEIIEILSSI